MHSEQKQPSSETVLKIVKEITVKFIETGKITPTNFDVSFRNIYHSITSTLRQDSRTDDNS